MSTELTYTTLEIPKEFFVNNPSNPLNERSFVYSTTHFEMVPFKGAQRYVEGATYPAKGIPTPNAIFALNQVKFLIKEALMYPTVIGFLLMVNKNKLLTSFNNVFKKQMSPYYIKDIYLCPAAYNTYLFVFNVLKDIKVSENIANDFAYNIAHVFEYDDAYRYRLQDMAYEIDIEMFKRHPSGEIKRLLSLSNKRQWEGEAKKVRKMITPIIYATKLPFIGKAFSKNIHIFKQAEYDEADWYWVCARDDYKYKGQEHEQRREGKTLPILYEINYEIK